MTDLDKPKEWGAKLLATDNNTATIRIFTPPNCIVAKWFFTFEMVLKKGENQKIYVYPNKEPIFVLFNPWCPGILISENIPALFKASFSFPQIIPQITQTHTLYTSFSFYIIFTIFQNIG